MQNETNPNIHIDNLLYEQAVDIDMYYLGVFAGQIPLSFSTNGRL